MVHNKKRPHIITYAATYLAVALAIGIALFFLSEAHKAAQRRAAALAAAKPKPPEPPPKPVPKPEPKPVPVPKPEVPVKKPEPPPPPPAPPAPDPMEEINRMVEEMHPMPAIRPLIEIVGNWQSVPPNAFPKLVSLKAPVSFELKRGGDGVAARGVLPAGSSVTPLELKGGNLRVTPSVASNISTVVNVDQTDFKEKIQERYDSFVKSTQAAVMARRAQEKERTIKSRNLEIALSKYGNGEDSRFDPMKASIRRGEAGMFQLESADRWRWAGKETVDGVEYDVGMVMMVSESAFGNSERELKALILGGKVVRWVDAATGSAL